MQNITLERPHNEIPHRRCDFRYPPPSCPPEPHPNAPSSPLQRPGQAGDENTPPPLRIAPQSPTGNKGASRERVFFVTAWQRGGPCQVASFSLSFFIRRRRPADERSRARQTRTSGVPVPTWPIICAALRAISSRSQNRGKTLRFRAQVAWNGKSSGAMGRCRQAPS